jgi:hypothetical protein
MCFREVRLVFFAADDSPRNRCHKKTNSIIGFGAELWPAAMELGLRRPGSHPSPPNV